MKFASSSYVACDRNIMPYVNGFCRTINLKLTHKYLIASLILVTAAWNVNRNTEATNPFDLRGTLRQKFATAIALKDFKGNVVCSPISAYLILGKLALGAEKPTIGELEIAIGIYNKEELKESYTTILSNLRQLPGAVSVNIASRLYLDVKARLQTTYCLDSVEVFGTCIERVDYRSPVQAARIINNWVSSQTNAKIPTILSANDISSSTSLIMVNAIYFSGIWRTTFPDLTWERFHTPRGERAVLMMSVSTTFFYRRSEDLKCHIVEIPYDGEAVSFVLVLPIVRGTLKSVLQNIHKKPDMLRAEMLKMEEQPISLSIPKFKIETSLDLNTVFKELGLRTMFNKQKSGLNGILELDKIFVEKSVQKAYIEVSEMGTVAAAASAAVVSVLSYREGITANHPFLFYIKSRSQQLFAGIYNGPS